LYWLGYLAEARDAVFEALLLYQTALAHEPRTTTLPKGSSDWPRRAASARRPRTLPLSMHQQHVSSRPRSTGRLHPRRQTSHRPTGFPSRARPASRSVAGSAAG
jgi:hypothetical protein